MSASMPVRRLSVRILGLAVVVALVACTSSEPDASGAPTATPAVPPAPVATPVACTPSAEPPAGQGEAWVRARAMLPVGLPLYRPPAPPTRFGPPVLWAACVEPGGAPQLTIVYRTGDESLAFLLNGGHSSWGNSPGPPTSLDKIIVRGVDGSLMTVTGGVSNQQPMLPFIALGWTEGGNVYQIKASSALLTPEDIRQIAESLQRVP